jgi:hypothetical protein
MDRGKSVAMVAGDADPAVILEANAKTLRLGVTIHVVVTSVP